MSAINWNNSGITAEQQQQFLQTTGLGALPDISRLTEAQWSALAGILGQETVATIRESVETPPLANPSLPPPVSKGDWSDIMMKVAEIKMKLSDIMGQASAEDVKFTKDKMKSVNEDNAKKIQESLKKLSKSSTSGLLGKIFGWIGAIAGLIGALVVTVASGGSAAPLLAVAVLGVVMMALEESGAMEKIMEAIVENPALAMVVLGPIAGGIIFGLVKSGTIDEEQMKMGIQIALAAIMLVTSIAAAVGSGGANFASVGAKIANIVAQVASNVASAGSGASGIASSVFSYDAAMIQADVQENKAWLAKLQAMLSEESERLEQILQQLNNEVAGASDMLQDISSSHRAIFNNYGM